MSMSPRHFAAFTLFNLIAALGFDVTSAFAQSPATSGIDTPASVDYLPFSIADTTYMTLGDGLNNYPYGLQISLGGLSVINGLPTNLGGTTTIGSTTAPANLTVTGALSAGTTSLGATTLTSTLQVNGNTQIGAGGAAASLTVIGSATIDYGATLNGNVTIGPCFGCQQNSGNLIIATGGSVTAPAYYHTSDMRLKTDIHPISNALDKLLTIKGVQFNWKQDGRADMGVVAQNVAEVFPDVVSKDKDGMMAVEYDSLVGPMIEAIRELKTQNDDLRSTIIVMDSKISAMDEMKAQLTDIRSTLKSLRAENEQLRSIRADKSLSNAPSNTIEH